MRVRLNIVKFRRRLWGSAIVSSEAKRVIDGHADTERTQQKNVACEKQGYQARTYRQAIGS